MIIILTAIHGRNWRFCVERIAILFNGWNSCSTESMVKEETHSIHDSPPVAQGSSTGVRAKAARKSAMNTVSTIFVVEPDSAICESISAIASVLELGCEAFVTGQDVPRPIRWTPARLFSAGGPNPRCQRPPDPAETIENRATLPLIFLTSAASVSIAVHAMRMGAFHFLEKPFHEHDLLSTLHEAIRLDQERRQAAALQDAIDTRMSILSAKEVAILELLADCKNKQAIAQELSVSVRTVEHHRTQMMRKLKTNSIAGLLRFALTMKKCFPDSRTGRRWHCRMDTISAIAQKNSFPTMATIRRSCQ